MNRANLESAPPAFTFASCEAERVVRRRAWALVREAVRTGQLVKPEVCSRCGKRGVIEAHHYDYLKPLEVVFLCRSCHRRVHRELRDRLRQEWLKAAGPKVEAKP